MICDPNLVSGLSGFKLFIREMFELNLKGNTDLISLLFTSKIYIKIIYFLIISISLNYSVILILKVTGLHETNINTRNSVNKQIAINHVTCD